MCIRKQKIWDSFDQLDIHHVPGIKLFMGSSTGNMLVDKMESLKRVFKTATVSTKKHLSMSISHGQCCSSCRLMAVMSSLTTGFRTAE